MKSRVDVECERSSLVALAAVTLMLVACNGGASPWSGTIEEVRVICGLEQSSPSGCSEACLVTTYYDAVEGPCAGEVADLRAQAEDDAYYDCALACPVSRMCDETPIDLTDCDCVAGCAASLSEGYQTAWIARELCIADATRTSCRR